MGNLICQGKSRSFPSEEKSEERYQELKTEIDEVKADLGEVQTNLDDVQERNYAFKYSGASKVEKNKIVNFNSRVYGEGVNNGVYTAPIGKYFIYDSSIEI